MTRNPKSFHVLGNLHGQIYRHKTVTNTNVNQPLHKLHVHELMREDELVYVPFDEGRGAAIQWPRWEAV